MPYIDVTVDVGLDEFEDQELIDELEGRGWIVSDEKGKEFIDLDDYELDLISNLTKDAKLGSDAYDLYLKVMKGTK